MTTHKSAIMTMLAAGNFPGSADVLARLMLIGRWHIDLSTKTIVDGDDVELFKMKAGTIPMFGYHYVSATLGSSTVAYGIAGSTAKYKAAATFTSTDAPTFWGKAAVMGVPLSADELLLATIAAANMPTAGIWGGAMYGLIRN